MLRSCTNTPLPKPLLFIIPNKNIALCKYVKNIKTYKTEPIYTIQILNCYNIQSNVSYKKLKNDRRSTVKCKNNRMLQQCS